MKSENKALKEKLNSISFFSQSQYYPNVIKAQALIKKFNAQKSIWNAVNEKNRQIASNLVEKSDWGRLSFFSDKVEAAINKNDIPAALLNQKNYQNK